MGISQVIPGGGSGDGGGGTRDLTIFIDGGGAEILDDANIWFQVDYDCEIQSWTLLADQTGSISLDIWVDSYANYPPDSGDSIVASAPPTLSSASKGTDSTLTGWTKSISAGDIVKINVDSCTTIERVALILKVEA